MHEISRGSTVGNTGGSTVGFSGDPELTGEIINPSGLGMPRDPPGEAAKCCCGEGLEDLQPWCRHSLNLSSPHPGDLDPVQQVDKAHLAAGPSEIQAVASTSGDVCHDSKAPSQNAKLWI